MALDEPIRPPVAAWVGVGANLGDARTTVRTMPDRLARLPATVVVAISPLYRSAPLEADGPDYINGVIGLHTRLTAPELLRALLAVEAEAGRDRPWPNAPRVLDLDLLLYGDASIQSPTLVVPHPRMWQRAFVLRPLADIAPQRVPAAALTRVAAQRIEQLPG